VYFLGNGSSGDGVAASGFNEYRFLPKLLECPTVRRCRPSTIAHDVVSEKENATIWKGKRQCAESQEGSEISGEQVFGG
jgi:hypothetical protein